MELPNNTEETKNLNLHQSNIETIDGAFLDYVEGLNLFCNTINGWQKVPIIWSSAERSFQIKDGKELRDKNGSLIPPIISLERASVTKDPTKKGGFQANLSPNRDRFYVTKILNQDKTSNFASADVAKKGNGVSFQTSKKNNKIVYQHIAIPIPIYVTVEYKINILTNYQSQMNEVVQPFMARTAQNYFIIRKDNFKYECFMDQNFSQEAINLGDEERKYKTTITVKVLGYFIGEGENQEKRQAVIDENAVEVKLPKENLIFVKEQEQRLKKLDYPTNAGTLVQNSLTTKKVFLIGDGINSQYTIAHGMNSRDLIIRVRQNEEPYEIVEVGLEHTDLNNILVDVGDPITSQSYAVIIFG
jgi:hypothetical protein